jgi:hypothetical protein
MRVRAMVLRAATGVLPVLVSTLVLVVVAGALPAPAAWALVGSLVAAAFGLLGGVGEGPACRLLAGARTPTDAEWSVLAPAVALACRAGLGPPLVELRVQPGRDRWVASPFGHRRVLVPQGLVLGVQQGTVGATAAAASICHAAAVTRAGLTSTGPAFAVWCLPWSLLRRCAAVAGRLTVLRLAWRARLVVVSVTVAQLLLARQVGLGLGVAALAGASYLLPAAERDRARYVTEIGDDGVQATGLGRDYVAMLDRAGAQVGLERRARLMFLAQEPTRDPKVLDLVRPR